MAMRQTLGIVLVALGLGAAVAVWHLPAGVTAGGLLLSVLSGLLLIDLEE